MDYEKKYKQSLALMGDCIPDEDGYVHVRPQDIFPELRELNDEGIRKVIYGLISIQPSQFFDNGFSKYEMLAWLEKQGEQKPSDEDMKEALQTEYEKGRADAIAEMRKGWSEKEKQMCADIIEAIKRSGIFKEAYKRELVDWLKSIKNRVIPQSKQEWSEEDENIISDTEVWLDTLCDYLKDSSSECIPMVKEIISKLKSLKDRYTWKPSDKQIVALRWILNNIPYCTHKEEISELLEQLKKLKE